jgi:hypothetical protein
MALITIIISIPLHPVGPEVPEGAVECPEGTNLSYWISWLKAEKRSPMPKAVAHEPFFGARGLIETGRRTESEEMAPLRGAARTKRGPLGLREP